MLLQKPTQVRLCRPIPPQIYVIPGKLRQPLSARKTMNPRHHPGLLWPISDT
jgi:hypothetical protein